MQSVWDESPRGSPAGTDPFWTQKCSARILVLPGPVGVKLVLARTTVGPGTILKFSRTELSPETSRVWDIWVLDRIQSQAPDSYLFHCR